MNLTRNNSSNNENRFEIILPGNTDKGKNYIINEDCCIRLWSRIHTPASRKINGKNDENSIHKWIIYDKSCEDIIGEEWKYCN